jgi:hypothetical protein
VRQMARGWHPGHIDALVHSLGTTAIWPEDYDYLASQQADILVTHEAPSSHKDLRCSQCSSRAFSCGLRIGAHGRPASCASSQGMPR